MAAAIPAANKWLLTKQASVAPSGLWDDRHGEAWGRCRKQGAEGKCWNLRLLGAWGGQPWGRRLRMILWCKVGDTPMRGCQKNVNRRGRWEWKKRRGGTLKVCVEGQGARHGESNCMQCAECSGPAVRFPFISRLYVRYNLPGCQASATISQRSPPPPPFAAPTPLPHGFRSLSITLQFSLYLSSGCTEASTSMSSDSLG